MLCRHPILEFRVFVKAIKGSFTKNQYRTYTCHLWYNFIRGVYTIISTKANLDFYSMNKCKYLLCANRTQIAIMWLLQCTLNIIYIHVYIKCHNTLSYWWSHKNCVALMLNKIKIGKKINYLVIYRVAKNIQ